MRDRMNVYFPPELLKQITDLADRKKLSRSAIVEAAVASFLSPDGADRQEAAFTRRLDRLSRQMQRLERDVGLTAETLALFIRFWLTITPPLPNDAQGAAQIKGRERFEGFVEALGRDGGPQHADAVALGEADETWPQIVNDAARGELKAIYAPVDETGKDRKPSLKQYPVIPWQLI